MSQIASFTYLKESDVYLLGFWSKPKLRFFRKSENKFNEYLEEKMLRKSVFIEDDGVNIALVFAWLELRDKLFATEFDPVLNTVRKQVSGSHWLIKIGDLRLISLIKEPMPMDYWPVFLGKIGADETYYSWHSFEMARCFTVNRFSELHTGEAFLVSVG